MNYGGVDRSLVYVFTGLLVLTACDLAAAQEYRVVRSFEIASEPACVPTVTRAPNGDVLVAFSTQWDNIPQGGVVKLVVSRDNGETWSEPKVLWKDKDPRVSVNANCGQTLSNGDVLLPINLHIIPKRKDIDPGETNPLKMYDFNQKHPEFRWEVRFLRSRDNGQTWTREDPKLHTPAGAFGRLLETRDGRLIKPMHWSTSSWYCESRDFGKTWGPRVFVTKRFGSEWNIVEAADGTFFAIIRGAAEPPRRTFGASFSRDGGKTWTAPRSAGVQGKMPDLLVLPSGRILMVVGLEGLTDGSEISTQKDRHSFCTLFISDDHGQTWKRDIQLKQAKPGSRIIPTDSPGLCLLDDGKVLVVLQAKDLSKSDHGLTANRPLSLIGNIIEPVG